MMETPFLFRAGEESPAPDAAALERYLAGDAPSDERHAIARWLRAHPGSAEQLAAIAYGLRHPDAGSRNDDAAAFEMRVMRASGLTGEPSTPRLPKLFWKRDPVAPSVSRAWSPRWVSVRGIAGAVAATAILVAAALLTHTARPSESATRYQTSPGQRLTVRLAGGTSIILAPSTTADVTSESMRLTGEAYVRLEPRATRAFTVQTSNAVVQVLGTTFSVRQYVGEPGSRVIVDEGRVTVRSLRTNSQSSKPAVVLTPHMLAVVSDSTIAVTKGIAPRDFADWTSGTLVFDHVKLSTAILELSRAYGAEIHVTDSALARKMIIAEVDPSRQSLSQVLDIMGAMLNSHYVRTDSAYLLTPGRRSAPDTKDRRNSPQPEKQYGR